MTTQHPLCLQRAPAARAPLPEAAAAAEPPAGRPRSAPALPRAPAALPRALPAPLPALPRLRPLVIASWKGSGRGAGLHLSRQRGGQGTP